MQPLLPLYLRIQIHHFVPLSFSSSSSEVALIVQPGFVVLIQTQQADPTLCLVDDHHVVRFARWRWVCSSYSS